jgi:hypothetical protein
MKNKLMINIKTAKPTQAATSDEEEGARIDDGQDEFNKQLKEAFEFQEPLSKLS